jgi:hypothetical protein
VLRRSRQQFDELLGGHEVDGPLVYALESEELLQRSLDPTRRKLHLFLHQRPR